MVVDVDSNRMVKMIKMPVGPHWPTQNELRAKEPGALWDWDIAGAWRRICRNF